MKEFTSIKNMIIKEAARIPDQEVLPESMTQQESSEKKTYKPKTKIFREFASTARKAMQDYYNAETHHHMTKEEMEHEWERKLALGIQ